VTTWCDGNAGNASQSLPSQFDSFSDKTVKHHKTSIHMKSRLESTDFALFKIHQFSPFSVGEAPWNRLGEAQEGSWPSRNKDPWMVPGQYLHKAPVLRRIDL